MRELVRATIMLAGIAWAMTTAAQDNAEKLSNPVASLISVPMQLNWDADYGPDDSGERYTLNVQPLIPVSISDGWNLISRTIHRPAHRSIGRHPGHRQSEWDRRRRAERVLFADGANRRWDHLERRPGIPLANRQLGKQLVSIAFGARYYLETPNGGPSWGLRLVFTLLYPK